MRQCRRAIEERQTRADVEHQSKIGFQRDVRREPVQRQHGGIEHVLFALRIALERNDIGSDCRHTAAAHSRPDTQHEGIGRCDQDTLLVDYDIGGMLRPRWAQCL